MNNEIKVGDTVRVSKDVGTTYGVIPTKREFIVNNIGKHFSEIRMNGTLMPMYYSVPTKYLVKVDAEAKEPTEAEKKPNIGSIKIPVEVDLTDSYWDAYAADLTKEIVLKVAKKYTDPKEAAEYAVKVAKAVVEGLKKK